ncbi:GANAB glucosidase, partial [Atractosteus spatula]|nr:GANAB glucosidase [Atractosteus spatula]
MARSLIWRARQWSFLGADFFFCFFGRFQGGKSFRFPVATRRIKGGAQGGSAICIGLPRQAGVARAEPQPSCATPVQSPVRSRGTEGAPFLHPQGGWEILTVPLKRRQEMKCLPYGPRQKPNGAAGAPPVVRPDSQCSKMLSCLNTPDGSWPVSTQLQGADDSGLFDLPGPGWDRPVRRTCSPEPQEPGLRAHPACSRRAESTVPEAGELARPPAPQSQYAGGQGAHAPNTQTPPHWTAERSAPGLEATGHPPRPLPVASSGSSQLRDSPATGPIETDQDRTEQSRAERRLATPRARPRLRPDSGLGPVPAAVCRTGGTPPPPRTPEPQNPRTGSLPAQARPALRAPGQDQGRIARGGRHDYSEELRSLRAAAAPAARFATSCAGLDEAAPAAGGLPARGVGRDAGGDALCPPGSPGSPSRRGRVEGLPGAERWAPGLGGMEGTVACLSLSVWLWNCVVCRLCGSGTVWMLRLCLAGLTLSALCLQLVQAVDRSNFKTCEQSSFCKRQRAVQPGQSPYRALLDTLQLSDSRLSLQLLNEHNKVKLLLELYGLQGNMTRIKINELKPLRPRFEVPDVLIRDPPAYPLTVVSRDDHGLVLSLGGPDQRLILSAHPFRLDIMEGPQLLLSVNSRGLLVFEHLRQRKDTEGGVGGPQDTRGRESCPAALVGSGEGATGCALAVIGPLRPGLNAPAALRGAPLLGHRLSLCFSPVCVRLRRPSLSHKISSTVGGLWDSLRSAFSSPSACPWHGCRCPKAESLSARLGLTNAELCATAPPLWLSPGGRLGSCCAAGESLLCGGGPSGGHEADGPAWGPSWGLGCRRCGGGDVIRCQEKWGLPPGLCGDPILADPGGEQRPVGLGAPPSLTQSPPLQTVFGKMLDYVQGASETPQTEVRWISESGIIDAFVMLGPRPTDVFAQYASLTVCSPTWMMLQSAPHKPAPSGEESRVMEPVQRGGLLGGHDGWRPGGSWARKPGHPRIFNDHRQSGPRFLRLIRRMAPVYSTFPKLGDSRFSDRGSSRRGMVAIVDPHIKVDSGYKIHNEIRSKGFYTMNKDGGDYEGWCWPGNAGYPDFTNPEMRSWWAGMFAYDQYEGSMENLYTWNDMNEPSVFNGPEVTMHKDALHGAWEHRDLHNLYGLYVQMATAEGQIRRSGGVERPFVLTRAFFAGSQRLGAVWTGDNAAEWDHLRISIPMCLSLGLVGISFCGADVGGFFKAPSSELLVRWYQTGAYQPFFRAHAHLDTPRREPWLFGDENMRLIREAVRQRYTLLPYWYTLFYSAYRTGQPAMRPLWVEYPDDVATFAMDDQFLLGRDLLVHPVTDEGARGVTAYLPGKGQVWYDVHTFQKHSGGQHLYIPVSLSSIPVFQRGGSIVPRKNRVRRSSSCMTSDPYTLYVALSPEGEAEGELFVDDEHTFRFESEHQFIHRRFVFASGALSSHNADPSGHFSSDSWVERVVILGASRPSAALLQTSDGSQSPLEFDFEERASVLTLRKPAVNVAADWTILLR